MSYCRWSSMDFGCDLYVYANVSGYWTIHVAGGRRKGEVPHLDYGLLDGDGDEGLDNQKFMDQYRTQMEALRDMPVVPISLPHAGETFDLATPGDCAAKMLELVALGYRCPEEAVAELIAEQREMDKGDN